MWWNEVKVNVQPVFVNYSPYRSASAPASLPRTQIQDDIDKKMSFLEDSLQGVKILEPYLIESKADIERLGSKITKETDFLMPAIAGHLYEDGWRHSLPTEVLLGDYDVPLIKLAFSEWDFLGLELVARLRSQGKAAYYAAVPAQANEVIQLARLRKILAKSKVVVFGHVASRTDLVQEGVQTNIFDPILIKEKLGVEVEYWTEDEIRREIEAVAQTEAPDKLADQWLEGSSSVGSVFREHEMERKYFISSTQVHLAMQSIMDKSGATAIAGCAEPGHASPDDALPCFSFTWFKDQGVPAGCEGDMNVTLATLMLMYVSNRPADMGNQIIPVATENMPDFYVSPAEDTVIRLTHSVTPTKLRGFDQPSSPYEFLGTHCSTCYGPNHYVDLDAGEIVTVCRFSPRLESVMLARGAIVKSEITRAEGNREVAYIDVGRKAIDFIKDVSEFGNHLCYVYGDYIDEMSRLCGDLGIESKVIASGPSETRIQQLKRDRSSVA